MYRILGSDGKEFGPVPGDQVRQWVTESRANAETRALAEGATEWKPLASFPEFSLLFRSFAAPATGRQSSANFPPRKTNPMAVTGFTLGLVSITFGMCCCHGVPFSVLGLIFSLVALDQIRSNPQLYEGRVLAWAGIALSSFSILLGVIIFLIFAALNILGGMSHRIYG